MEKNGKERSAQPWLRYLTNKLLEKANTPASNRVKIFNNKLLERSMTAASNRVKIFNKTS